jgi:hypothetical protein
MGRAGLNTMPDQALGPTITVVAGLNTMRPHPWVSAVAMWIPLATTTVSTAAAAKTVVALILALGETITVVVRLTTMLTLVVSESPAAPVLEMSGAELLLTAVAEGATTMIAMTAAVLLLVTVLAVLLLATVLAAAQMVIGETIPVMVARLTTTLALVVAAPEPVMTAAMLLLATLVAAAATVPAPVVETAVTAKTVTDLDQALGPTITVMAGLNTMRPHPWVSAVAVWIPLATTTVSTAAAGKTVVALRLTTMLKLVVSESPAAPVLEMSGAELLLAVRVAAAAATAGAPKMPTSSAATVVAAMAVAMAVAAAAAAAAAVVAAAAAAAAVAAAAAAVVAEHAAM